MGILTNAANRRDISAAEAFHDRFFGGPGVWPVPRDSAGAYVTEDTAMQISTVFTCVLQLSETIATLPLLTYERLKNGGKARAPKHPLFKLLHSRFNPETTSTAGRMAMAAWYFLWGNAYAQIERSKGGVGPRSIKALWVLPADRMTVQRGRNIAYGVDPEPDNPRLWYYNSAFDDPRMKGMPREWPADQILHIPGFGFDGIKGLSRIALARRSLGLTVDAEEMGSAFFANGMNLDCTIETPNKFTQTAHDNIMKTIIEPNQGRKGMGGAMLLWEGMQLKKLTMPLKDAQFIEGRTFQIAEVCRWFNFPLHKAKNMAAATWGNVEQENISYVVDTVRPHLVGWEQGFALKLFEGDDDHFSEFLVDGLLRGDKLTRTQSCQLEHNNGNLTNDEWREIENRNPCEDGKGDKRYIPAFLVEADAPPLPAPVPNPAQTDEPSQKPIPPDQTPGGKKTLNRAAGDAVRAKLSNSFGLILQDAAARVVRREVVDMQRALPKIASGGFEGVAGLYYAPGGAFADYFARAFGPVVRAYGEQVVEYAKMEIGAQSGKLPADFGRKSEARAAEYVMSMWETYQAASIAELTACADIAARLDEWSEHKASDITERERVAIAEAFAMLVFTEAGIETEGKA